MKWFGGVPVTGRTNGDRADSSEVAVEADVRPGDKIFYAASKISFTVIGVQIPETPERIR